MCGFGARRSAAGKASGQAPLLVVGPPNLGRAKGLNAGRCASPPAHFATEYPAGLSPFARQTCQTKGRMLARPEKKETPQNI